MQALRTFAECCKTPAFLLAAALQALRTFAEFEAIVSDGLDTGFGPESAHTQGEQAMPRVARERWNLTHAQIKRLPVPEAGKGPRDFLDSHIQGLLLRVTGSGARVWYWRGTVPTSGRQCYVKIGPWPAVTTDQARAGARRVIGWVAEGIDPNERKQRLRRERTTLDDLFQTWLDDHARARKRSWRADEANWERYCRGPLGARLAREVTHDDLVRWHARIAREAAEAARAKEREKREQDQAKAKAADDGTPPSVKPGKRATRDGQVAANRALSLLRTVCNATPLTVWGPEGNPCRLVRRFEEQSRERFLSAAELSRFFAALAGEIDRDLRDFVLTAMWTGARKSNLMRMQWADVDLDQGIWVVASGESKGRRAMRLSLIDQVVQLLRLRRAEQDARDPDHRLHGTPWVFPAARGDGAMRDIRRRWEALCTEAKLENLHVHDLRRTIASWQLRIGTPLHTIGLSLGHHDPRATAVYARLDDGPVRAALQAAANAMEAAARDGAAPASPDDQTSSAGPDEDDEDGDDASDS